MGRAEVSLAAVAALVAAAGTLLRLEGRGRFEAALGDADPATRRGAALVLARQGAASAWAVPQLRALLADDETAAAAAHALAEIGPAAAAAVPALAERAAAGDLLLRCRALYALCRIAAAAPETEAAVAAAADAPLLRIFAIPYGREAGR